MDYKEKNQQFLSWFWDLASDDRERRLGAANGILAHVDNAVKVQKGMNEDGSMVIDLDYALKRLVRGLSSSRDSARHGFATCLAALLASGAVPLKVALPIIDESTHIRGKIKGSEERDLMFGKLFAYLSIARSGLLARDAEAGIDLFKRLLELHRMRGWLREVVSEALFVILRAMDPAADLEVPGSGPANAVETALEALGEEDLLRGELSDWSPWQLQLALGLQQYAGEFKEVGEDSEAAADAPAYHKSIRKRVHKLLPAKKMDTPELLLGPLAPVLVNSAAGFPKIHHVWDLLMRSVFGTASDATGLQLPAQRSLALGRKQEALLMALVAFIEKHLLVPSHEKRSLAFRLTVLLAKHTPVDLLSRALHKSVLRGLVAARVNRKHTLYTLAGTAVQDLVSTVVPWDEAAGQWASGEQAAGDAQARVALASVLVSHASANFDSLTGIPAVSTLLQGLDETAVLSHVQGLVRLVAGATDLSVETEAVSVEGEEQPDEDVSRSAGALAAAALEALASLAKNARLSCRGTVCSVVGAVLTRIACFEEAALPSELSASDGGAASKKGKGKKGGKDKDTLAAFKSSVDADNAKVSPHIIEALIAVSPAPEGRVAYPAPLVASASAKLLTLLADAGNMTSHHLNTAAHTAQGEKEKDKKKENDNAPNVLVQATAVAALLSSSGVAVRTSLDSTAIQVQEEDGTVDTPLPQDAFNAACAAIQTIANANKPSALASALCALLGHASFQMLSANAELAQAVIDISVVAPSLAAASGAAVEPIPEDDNEDTVLDQQLGSLLDACFELVAQNEGAVRAESLSVKGVTAAIKRVWASVGKDLPVGLGILENIVGAIVGEDGDDDAEDEEAPQSGDEDEQEQEGEDDDEEEVQAAPKKEKKEKLAKKDVVSDEEEDVLLDEEAALDMLATENSDDEEELANLQGMLHVAEHSEEADSALVHMLEMRKANRKAGLLDAKRKQLLVRSRAVDMLEAVLSRIETAELLMPLLSPLLLCLRKIQTGLTQSLAEGRAFESRLRGFIDQRICRKKFVLSHFGDEETKEGIADMVSGLCAQLHVDIQCPFAPMRQIAAVALVCVSRSTIGGDCAAAKHSLGQFTSELLQNYFQHKKSRLTSAVFEEHFSRFADFSIPYCVGALSQGCATAVSPFLRSEASRMLQVVVRRFTSLAEATRTAVLAALPAVLQRLSAALAQCSAGTDGAETSAKRVKPILQCLRDVCLLPVCVGKLADLQALGRTARQVEAPKKGKGKGKKAQEVVDVIDVEASLTAMDAALVTLVQKQPALVALAQQTQAALTGVRDSKSNAAAALVSPKAEKVTKNNKRKATDSLEAAEQRLVAQSEAAMEEAEVEAAGSKTRGNAPWHASADKDVEEPKAKKSKKTSK